MLPRSTRLQESRLISRVYQRGNRQQGAYLIVRSLPNKVQRPRVAIVVSTNVSKKATERNRTKRVLRALLSKLSLPPADMVVSVRRLPKEEYSGEFQKELTQWFRALL